MTHEEIYEKLILRLKEYHPSADFSMVKRAYEVALVEHGGQLRKSGEPYVIHPMTVAYILADLELDIESIVSGILHDVIEDTRFDYKDVEAQFSKEIADIVEGVTKLDRIEDSLKVGSRAKEAEEGSTGKDKSTIREELQAENYRKMFIAMAKDIRVILIKIADRLHNMRTLQFMRPEKQKEKAQETLDIYAPLAHRLGISKLRHELEDLSFYYLHKEEYDELSVKLSIKQKDRKEYIGKVVDELRTNLKERGMEAMVDGRPKHLFSIYKKMVSQNKTLDQIFDIFAVRIIVERITDCYEALGFVHDMYKPIPGRFKDYVAMPKPNKYQSLHTVVIGPGGEPIEIQIRTFEMHRTSEFGIAAHWKYKEGKGGGVDPNSEEAKLAWLRQILDWQRELSDNKEFLSALKTDLDVYTDHVYCFTPKGEIVSLVKGSTPLDFAYAIHSAVGNRMIGCRVNGVMVPFEYEIQSGDRISVLTSQNSKGPSLDWLNIVKTNQAKNKINQWFKKENKSDNILKGKELLEKEAKRKGLPIHELLVPKRKDVVLNKYGFGDWDSLCAAIGHGGIKEGQVLNRLNEEYQKEQDKLNPPEIKLVKDDQQFKHSAKKSGIVINGFDDISVRFSRCCSPVPGDEIIGFVTTGRGVSIHRTDCINIISLDEINRQRLVECEWQLPQKAASSSTEQTSYNANIKVVGTDRVGLLFEVTKLLSEEKIQIVDFTAQTMDGTAIFTAVIKIEGKKQLEKITKKIYNMKGVSSVERLTK